jgi:hypothetical protein
VSPFWSRDSQYRQEITNQIIEAGQVTVDFQIETSYYEDLLRSVRQLDNWSTPDRATAQLVDERFHEVYTSVVHALEQANEAYREISAQNLNPRTNLYSITSPFSIQVQRALTLRMLVLYLLLGVLASVLIVPLGCLVHHYFRHEILPPRPGVGPAPVPEAERVRVEGAQVMGRSRTS